MRSGSTARMPGRRAGGRRHGRGLVGIGLEDQHAEAVEVHAGTGLEDVGVERGLAQLGAGGQADPGRPGEAARRGPGVGARRRAGPAGGRSCRAPPGSRAPGPTAGRHPGRRDGRWSSDVAQWAWQIPSRSLITKKSRRDGARYRRSRIGSCSRDASCWRAPAPRPAWPRSVRSRGVGRDGRPRRPVLGPPRPRRRRRRRPGTRSWSCSSTTCATTTWDCSRSSPMARGSTARPPRPRRRSAHPPGPRC